MNKITKNRLKVSGNPCAYDYYENDVELLDESRDLVPKETIVNHSTDDILPSSSSPDTQSNNVDTLDLHEVRKDLVTKVTEGKFDTDNRRVHPYAYIDDNDSIVITAYTDTSTAVYSYKKIEQKARKLQLSIWNKRDLIWPGGAPTNPVEMLDPEIAIKFIGYDFEHAEFLGDYRERDSKVAGIIDQSAKKISISRQFIPQVRRYTAAHELGHALLHNQVSMHRDRPVDGSGQKRMGIEVEADKFATYFLMPEKLVRKYFSQVFGDGVFKLTVETAFALNPRDPNDLVMKCKNSRALSRILAKAEYYNGIHVRSLADRLCVSVETMAIRIEELNLFAL